ncbi:hypothetical protein [Streptomyces sp. NPDC048419]|uniref:hypothetical protein n=1 Tax=Streptomyces sp. NPDC048419 TaxID=3365547 RepID=UPI003720CEBA
MLEVPEEAVDAPVAQVAPQTPAAPARRGRTILLVAGAALLGIVAGTCTGYLIQADREPTKLPPLSQPVLTQAKGKAHEPLSAAQDRQVRADGDLRKLLLKKPRGAKTADWTPGDGWMDLAAYAESYQKPGTMFGRLVTDEFRRAAVTGWQAGGNQTVEIRLIQFRQQESLEAADSSDSSQYWADREPDTDSWTIPGTGSGMAYVHHRPDSKAGYLPLYGAQAHAYRGDITMEIWIYDTKPITKARIMDLAERQMERLRARTPTSRTSPSRSRPQSRPPCRTSPLPSPPQSRTSPSPSRPGRVAPAAVSPPSRDPSCSRRPWSPASPRPSSP